MVQTFRHLFTPQRSNNERPRILHVEGFLVFTAIVLVSFLITHTLKFTGPNILGFASSITPSQVIDQTNRTRASLGLPPLASNNLLAQAAQAKGNSMCGEQYWAHVSPSGTTPWVFIKNAGYKYAVAGENLARDFADTNSMLSAWMASPTHRANIVSERYKEIGIAVLDCNLLGSDTALVVQMFGTQVTGTPTTTKTAATTVAKTEETKQVAGTQSVPKVIENVNPKLVLETPPPQANPTGARILSPLQFVKIIMVAILVLLIFVLSLDLYLEHSRHTVRLVGKNLAHILFLSGILMVVIIIKAGLIY